MMYQLASISEVRFYSSPASAFPI